MVGGWVLHCPLVRVTEPGKGLNSIVKTYQDFEWVLRDYPWIENGLFVTYVKGANPTTVLEGLTVEDLGQETGLSGVNERGWDELSIIGAASLGEWTIAIAPVAPAGASDELMRPLSVGRDVLTHFQDIEASSGFLVWKDGERTAYFDPLLRCGMGLDPMPAEWESRMQDVGIDPHGEGPLPDGRFHAIEASFAMAANYTGVQITPEFLSTATFSVGSAD
jgi:hypothetical protein